MWCKSSHEEVTFPSILRERNPRFHRVNSYNDANNLKCLVVLVGKLNWLVKGAQP